MALTELQKIPGFVRGKIKRNTEKYARENIFVKLLQKLCMQQKKLLVHSN